LPLVQSQEEDILVLNSLLNSKKSSNIA